MSIELEKMITKLGDFPMLYENATLYDAISLMNYHKLGTVCITNKNLNLKGIFTDGDLRRIFLKVQKPLSAILIDDISSYMNKKPQFFLINNEITKKEVIIFMKKNKIWDVPFIDQNGKLYGIIHLHNLIYG